MIIIGTEKIRSVLDLPIVKLQIKKGEKRYVSEKDFWGSDVQNAITLGFLKADKEEVQTSLDVNDRMARIKNISGRPISIPGFSEEVKSNQIFTIKESRLKEGAFQNAMVRKMIAVLGILGSENDISEGSVFLDDGSYVKTSKEEPKEPSEATVTLTREFFKEKKTEKEEPLETNIEVKPRGVIEVSDPKPIEKDEIPDAKRRSVVWNPTKQPVFVEMDKTEEVVETPPSEPEKDQKKASIVWDPTKGKGKEAVVVNPNKENNAEIKFVDSEQEEQKIASHPKMGGKKGKKNS